MSVNQFRWQAPGNGKIFDAPFGVDSYMNKRSICVLIFIKQKCSVLQKDFELDIKDFLFECATHEANESIASHFYRPLLFLGFLQQREDGSLELTLEGDKFLEAFEKARYNECKIYLINQLDNCRYPNRATSKTQLHLFPFRILFKLLLDQQDKGISIEFIKEKLVNIKSFKDLVSYAKSKNLDDIQKGKGYDKFHTWVINSLVDIEILKRVSKSYYIHDDLVDYIEQLYKDISYKELFFSEDNLVCELNNITSKRRYKRDPRLINIAKNRDNFRCVVDETHLTFTSNRKNYVEGHHLIPMFWQKNYSFKLDDVNNILSLCPNCHRKIHFADDKREMLDVLYEKNREYLSFKGVCLDDLYKIYSCVA